MEILFPIILGIISLVCLHVSTHIFSKPSPKAEPLPEIITKPSQTPLFQEWNREYSTLLQATCKRHYGTNSCNNCGVTDPQYEQFCTCDYVSYKSLVGKGLGVFVLHSDKNCEYHTKEHYFE